MFVEYMKIELLTEILPKFLPVLSKNHSTMGFGMIFWKDCWTPGTLTHTQTHDGYRSFPKKSLLRIIKFRNDLKCQWKIQTFPYKWKSVKYVFKVSVNGCHLLYVFYIFIHFLWFFNVTFVIYFAYIFIY